MSYTVLVEWKIGELRRRFIVEDETKLYELQELRPIYGTTTGWFQSHPTLADMAAIFDASDDRSIMDGFDDFWNAYPAGHKIKKPDAKKAWRQTRKKRPKTARIVAALERWKSSDKWQRGYVEHPATWLRAEMWNDAPPPPPNKGGGSPLGPGDFHQANLDRLRGRKKQ